MYCTSSEGTGGVIREKPEYFRVEEILNGRVIRIFEPLSIIMDFLPKPKKMYLHFTLVKKNWNTIDAVREIAGQLKIGMRKFGFCGLKDKRAITAQRVSVFNEDIAKLRRFRAKGIWLHSFSYENFALREGMHDGNLFTITITRVKNARALNDFLKEVDKIRNFYGIQRFGEVRPNHLVGREIVKGNLEKAAKLFLTMGDEPYRRWLAENWPDFRGALQRFPKYLWPERRMLAHLIKAPKDYAGAFRTLPLRLRRIFTAAYQSYLFNKRVKDFEGEILVVPGFDMTEDEEGVYRYIFKEEGITKDDLRCKKMPELRLKKSYRDVYLRPKIIKAKTYKTKILLKFVLSKGKYATVLLDELMKVGPCKYCF